MIACTGFALPITDRAALGRLIRRAGDYAIACGLGVSYGLGPLPRFGPVVTWRPLARPAVAALGELALSLGDLELF